MDIYGHIYIYIYIYIICVCIYNKKAWKLKIDFSAPAGFIGLCALCELY